MLPSNFVSSPVSDPTIAVFAVAVVVGQKESGVFVEAFELQQILSMIRDS